MHTLTHTHNTQDRAGAPLGARVPHHLPPELPGIRRHLQVLHPSPRAGDDTVDHGRHVGVSGTGGKWGDAAAAATAAESAVGIVAVWAWGPHGGGGAGEVGWWRVVVGKDERLSPSPFLVLSLSLRKTTTAYYKLTPIHLSPIPPTTHAHYQQGNLPAPTPAATAATRPAPAAAAHVRAAAVGKQPRHRAAHGDPAPTPRAAPPAERAA